MILHGYQIPEVLWLEHRSNAEARQAMVQGPQIWTRVKAVLAAEAEQWLRENAKGQWYLGLYEVPSPTRFNEMRKFPQIEFEDDRDATLFKAFWG